MIVIENEWLKVSIASRGAEVREVVHKKNERSYMWEGDPTYWGRISPVLFPIVGRLKKDRYQVDGVQYELSQHGFLRDQTFTIGKINTEQAEFIFQSEGRFQEQYPYEFKAVITYSLQRETLSVHWEVTNETNEAMYFSIGAHPAFRVPQFEGETINDYEVTLRPAEGKTVMEYELSEGLVREKELLTSMDRAIPLSHSAFKNDALIFSHIDSVRLASTKNKFAIDVVLPGFPFLGIWSKYDEKEERIAPFVCIEPWYGLADMEKATGELSEKTGMNKLEASEVFQAEYQMTFYE
ncbi:aldose 1-epimerase family protein [Shouchella shacheensis]|uniref:aldose 1-epimerase family protein n=1 Tax=Shouchella shacheensis TaxID=1649580 RepID=UPI00073FA8B7|nr:aldose 1-epimerase family protein [Shouchella shacheensis]